MIDRSKTLLHRVLEDVAACVGDDPLHDDGESWLPACAAPKASVPFSTEAELTALRNECRRLACENEFALCAIENRISYVVGSGHTYRVVPRDDAVPRALLRRAESVLDRFLRENRWHRRQSEIQRRLDRDGEVFLRMFDTGDGLLRLRFVDPEQVGEPSGGSHGAGFGIECEAGDVESVVAYWIDGRRVPGRFIQHRKANVDANVKRGLSLFYPVRKNLKRAEKLLRNMSVVAGIQSAVALIRKHARRDRPEIERFVAAQADRTGGA
ncbi:MAG: phage portal protein, partial [Planctomycetota bacterium]